MQVWVFRSHLSYLAGGGLGPKTTNEDENQFSCRQSGHHFYTKLTRLWGSPGASEDKESACNVGDLGSIPGSGRSPGEGNGNPLQYSWLENSMDREPDELQSIG